MAQMQLDMSRLTQITGEDLDGKKERRAILDYLYQLTEQLRYWQNNIEQENMTPAFAQDYDGMKKGMAEIRLENDGIRLLVEETEGKFAEILLTADGARIMAQDAANKVASLTVEVDRIESMVGSLNGPANYVQYEEPEAPEAGDIWVDTGHSTWEMLGTGLWADAGVFAWGHWYNRLYKTRVYDGSGWVLLSDEAQILKQETRITETEESITLMAMRQQAVEGAVETHQTLIQQNADAISLKASSAELGSLQEEVAMVKVESGRITLKVQELENKKPSNLDNGVVVIDQQGVHMHGGTVDLDANSAVNVESGGSVNISAGAALTVNAENFKLNEQGQLTATGATLNNATINGITAGEIDAGKVTVKNLNADNITAGKLNGMYISELGAGNLQSGAVETEKLADEAVTGDKIKAETIEAKHIAAETITADKIKANAITANKLASDVGSSLDLSSNAAITALVRDVDALPVTYVQYDAPGEKKVGDIWINTGGARWSGLAKGTWTDAAAARWGDYYNRKHKTRVWNGQAWEVLADQAVTIDQETRIRQTEESLKLTATRTELAEESKRISQAEEKITPSAIIQTVRSSEAYREDLSKKVEQTVFDQTSNAFEMRVQTVEAQSGKAETVTNAALTLDGTGIHMKTGGTFTVDSGNFDVDANGNVSMNNASVNGELLSSGQPVLTSRNLVVSSTTPKNPIVGTVWVKPVGAVVATFVYNNPSVASFEKMESAHTLSNLGSPTTASGTYTWNASIPYKVLSPVTAARYLRMTVNGTVLFDTALNSDTGTYTLHESGTLPTWLGNAEALSFTLELHFLQGNESYLHNVHRLNTGAVELKLTAATDAAQGWMATEVQVYNGTQS